MALWPTKKIDTFLNTAAASTSIDNQIGADRLRRFEQDMMGRAFKSGGIGYPDVHANSYGQKPPVETSKGRLDMIAMRLRITDGAWLGFEHIDTALSGEKVFVFIVQSGSPVTLEDDAGLFPSDVLVTQLRLLQK